MLDKANLKALQDSWSKQQLAEFIYEELHTAPLSHIVDTKYEVLAKDISISYIKTLTKKEMIVMLFNLNFNLEPEPDKEV